MLTLLTNNGSGGFGFSARLNVGLYPNCIAVGDINGDGELDLITANYGTNTLTVLTNNGSGVFGSNATLVVGNGPFSVAAVDLNGDGKLDLISANYDDGTLTVLTNNGGGAFGFNATIAVGTHPAQVVAADVNGDGKPDLICANEGDNTLTVLTQVIASPTLSITSTGSNTVTISWPSSATGFTLQTNSDLSTTNWAPVGYAISTNGPTQSVTLAPPPAGNLFFRLSLP